MRDARGGLRLSYAILEGRPIPARQLIDLSPIEFENLIFDLVRSSGMRNLTWRTPGADGGRDLEGEHLEHDYAGASKLERWFIEMKRYAAAVDWPTVWAKLAYADNAQADFLLMTTTSSFSPKCLDEMQKWNQLGRRPTVRGWSGHELEFRIRQQPAVALKYGLSERAASLAPAFAPLTLHLAKMTMAAENSLLLNGDAGTYLTLSAAIAELLMVRSEDFAHSGNIVPRKPLKNEPWYPWLKSSEVGALDGLDVPMARAIACAMRLLSGCTSVLATARPDSSVEISAEDPRRDVIVGTDLFEALALWGACEVKLDKYAIVITMQRAQA